jgi:glycosyltransferase involved in cell wall biosynthesis
VIVATEVVKKSYAEKFCGAVAEKFVCVPNGYDSEDFKIALKNRTIKPDKLKISYLGEFYFGRTPEVFLQAVSDLIREGHVSREKISIKFIGNVRNIGRKSLESLVQKLDLSSLTEIIEPVPYHKAIECMVSSDVLLVFSPQAFFQPTKVFEYMFAEAWVIAFTPSGALSDVVRQYPKGIVVDYNDVEGAKKALMVCYGKFAEGNAKKGENVTGWRELLARYDRKNLTGELAKYL